MQQEQRVRRHGLGVGAKIEYLTIEDLLAVFYGLNGVRVVATDDELFDLVMDVAHGSTRAVATAAAALRDSERPT